MYYALHNNAGIIRKVLKGPSMEWAKLNRSSEDELIFESETEINNATEKIENGARVPYAPEKSPEQIQSDVIDRTQARLDDFARSRNYDSILSAATYATSSIPQFASEGQYAVEIRDATWMKIYDMLNEIQAGNRQVPQSYVDIEGELPALQWPS